MKRTLRITALLLALLLTFTVSAMAADGLPTKNEKAQILNIVPDATVTFASAEEDEEKIIVTYTNETAITEGSYYLVLALSGDGSAINKDTILYINQVTGSSDHSISFEVYPSSLKDSVILITGSTVTITEGKVGLQVALIDVLYILGDVDGNGLVNVGDATLLLRYLASLEPASKVDMDAANVDGNTLVNVGDATKLLRALAGLESLEGTE